MELTHIGGAKTALNMRTMPFPSLGGVHHTRAKVWLSNFFLPDNVFAAQNFSLFIFSFTGLASWKSAGPDKEQRLHSNLRLVNMAAQCSGYMASLCITLSRQENFISFFFINDVSEITSLIELIIAMLAVAVIYYKCYVRRRNYRKLFVLLHAVDQQFAALGRAADKVHDFGTTVWFSIKLMVATWILLAIYVVSSYLMQWGTDQMAHMYAWVAYFWPQLIIAMALNLGVTIMWQLGERFKRLNRVSSL